MSTKIWVARRFPVSKINDFIDFCNETFTQRVVEHVTKYMNALKPDYEPLRKRIEAHKKFCSKENEECPEWHMRNCRFKAYMAGAVEAGKSMQRTLIFDIECGINLWVYKRKAYVIPWGEFHSRVEWPEWAEDYHYQNQTDPPEDIPYAQFRKRGKVWDKVCLDDWNARRLSYDIISLREGQSYESSIKLEQIIVPEVMAAWRGEEPSKISLADAMDV
jgi:hypothetical protein